MRTKYNHFRTASLAILALVTGTSAFALELPESVQKLEEQRIAAIAKASQPTISVFGPKGGGGGSGVVITPPEGWSLVRDDTVVDQLVFPDYQKKAGPSEPDSYTFSLSRKKHPVEALLAFRGGIINDHGGGNSDISATTQVAPSINAASEDVLLYVAAVRSDAKFTPPPGMIELTDGEDTSRALTTALELATDSGPTGTRSGTSSSDGVWAAALISLTTLTE